LISEWERDCDLSVFQPAPLTGSLGWNSSLSLSAVNKKQQEQEQEQREDEKTARKQEMLPWPSNSNWNACIN